MVTGCDIPAPPAGDVPGLRFEALQGWWRDHAEGRADHRLALWSDLSLHHHFEAMRRAKTTQARSGAPDTAPRAAMESEAL